MKLEKKEYICDICKQIFLRRRYFIQHFRRHTKRADKNKNENAAPLADLLPKNWKYITKSYEPQVHNKNFTATVLVFELCTSDQVKEWMKEFMNINKCNYILKHLDTRESRFAKSKHVYMCRYLNRRSNKSSCQSCIRVVIRRNWENSAYFAVISIKYVHNHSPDCAAILRYRSPSEQVQEFFRSLFENGVTPSQAFNSYKQHLYEQYSTEYDAVVADRSICPDQRWVYYFYQKFLKLKSGPTPTEQMITSVKNSVQEFNVTYKENVCFFHQVDDNNFVIVVLTPLMRRASHLPNAGEMICVNYESDVSRLGLHVYLMFTSCCAGGIPVGVVITSSNSESVISEGFRLYCSVTDDKCFGGRLNGPEIVMADDCPGLKIALEYVFPSSHIFLSIFQILESGWKWLWKLENGIDSKYRKSFYNYLQRLMYCTQPDLLEIIFADLLSDGNVEKYKNYVAYVNDLYSRRKEWAICLHDRLPVDKESVKNIIEKSMKVFKEKVFKKLRSYNPAQLFHYIIDNFNAFYEQKLLDVAVNENYNYLNQHTTISQEQLSKYKMEYITDSVIMLTNTRKNVNYVINKDVGACSCYLGEAGLACKHLSVINYYFNQRNSNDYSISEEEKQHFYYVAVGASNFTPNDSHLILVTDPTSGTEAANFTIADKSEIANYASSDIIEEEVVVVLNDDDERYMHVSDCEEVCTSDDSFNDVNQLKDNIDSLLDRVKNNIPFFSDVLVKINDKLRLLNEQNDEKLLSSLSRFVDQI